MLGILHRYNVGIPQVVMDLLNHTVQDYERRLLQTVHFVEEEEGDVEFRNLRMKDLKTLKETLDQFLIPIIHLIEFLVHFSMHRSHIFSQYLQERLRLQQTSAPKVPAVLARASTSTVFAGLEDVIPDQVSTAEDSESGTMQVSIVSVFCTKSSTC